MVAQFPAVRTDHQPIHAQGLAQLPELSAEQFERMQNLEANFEDEPHPLAGLPAFYSVPQDLWVCVADDAMLCNHKRQIYRIAKRGEIDRWAEIVYAHADDKHQAILSAAMPGWRIVCKDDRYLAKSKTGLRGDEF